MIGSNLISRWQTILDKSIEELHTAVTPHSDTLQTHYSSLKAMHLDISRVAPHLGEKLHTYIDLLEQSLCHMLNADRARSMAIARYLQVSWLPAFAVALEQA